MHDGARGRLYSVGGRLLQALQTARVGRGARGAQGSLGEAKGDFGRPVAMPTMASIGLTCQRPRCILEAGLFEGLDVIQAVAHLPR